MHRSPSPLTLPSWPLDAVCQHDCLCDTHTIHNDLEKRKKDLFVDDDEIDVTVYEYVSNVSQKRHLQSLAHVNAFALETRQPGSTVIVSISQTTSWSELDLSKNGCHVLFGALNICPSFWQTMKHFCATDNPDRETAGGLCAEYWNADGSSFEISFVAKYVQEHGQGYHPWATRQVGFFHRYDSAKREHTIIILRPFESLTRRLEKMTDATDVSHAVGQIMTAATENYDDYLTHLESRCRELSKKAILSSSISQPGSAFAHHGFQLHFSDIQELEKLHSDLLLCVHMINVNLSIVHHLLQSPLATRTSSSSHQIPLQPSGLQVLLSTLSSRYEVHKSRGTNIVQRLDGISILGRSILDARTFEQLRASSSTTAELAQLARDDSIQSTKRARTLNTITVLGFVYLPASFVATLLGCQYIRLASAGRKGAYTLEVDPEMWIFLVLTVVMFFLTGVIWFGLLMWERCLVSKKRNK